MRTISRILLAGLAVLAVVPITWIGIYATQRVLGYFPGGHFPTIAKYAAEKKDVRLCRRIVDLPWPTVGGPSVTDARLSCIHEYASLTKDPRACELLLPSDYGKSCLGTARKNGEPCSINYNRDVSWWINSPYDQPLKATIEECRSGTVTSEKGRKCCHILRITSDPGFDSCSVFESGSAFSDQCLSQLALKKGQGELCEAVADDNARVICELEVKYR